MRPRGSAFGLYSFCEGSLQGNDACGSQLVADVGSKVCLTQSPSSWRTRDELGGILGLRLNSLSIEMAPDLARRGSDASDIQRAKQQAALDKRLSC